MIVFELLKRFSNMQEITKLMLFSLEEIYFMKPILLLMLLPNALVY